MKIRALGIFVGVGLAVAVVTSTGRASSSQNFDVAGGRVGVTLAPGWEGFPGLFDIPLMLVGPEKDGSQPTLSMIPTSIPTSVIDPAQAKDQQKAYRKGREEWLEGNGGRLVEFLPYRELPLAGGSVHALGYRYELGDETFAETTFYVSCKGKYFQLQSLMTESERAEGEPAVEQMVRSLACE